eukprot:scaffold140981_cov169-Phaeocystis_antarctica.AAC.1
MVRRQLARGAGRRRRRASGLAAAFAGSRRREHSAVSEALRFEARAMALAWRGAAMLVASHAIHPSAGRGRRCEAGVAAAGGARCGCTRG